MKLHELKPAENATKASKRIGRGQGSGKGGTSTKGHKGAQSRAGYSRKIGFEGGQMPIYRLLPKRGFKNINRVEYSPINLRTLQMLADKTQQTEITLELMKANGLISMKDKIKILGNGEITSKLTVTAHAFSKTAKEMIEKAGGKCIALMSGGVEEEKARKHEGTKGEGEKGEKENINLRESVSSASSACQKTLENIILYPNPTTGELEIRNYELGIKSIEVFDVYGRKVSSHHLITSSSNQKINISHINSGIYFVKIITEQGEVVKKIVKL